MQVAAKGNFHIIAAGRSATKVSPSWGSFPVYIGYLRYVEFDNGDLLVITISHHQPDIKFCYGTGLRLEQATGIFIWAHGKTFVSAEVL